LSRYPLAAQFGMDSQRASAMQFWQQLLIKQGSFNVGIATSELDNQDEEHPGLMTGGFGHPHSTLIQISSNKRAFTMAFLV